MKLAELEHYFASAATSGSGPLPGLDRVFLGNERLSAQDRLAIYNRGYFYRLLDALASVFSQTQRLLGNADFERLGLAYLAQHPSEHPAVERVGRSFCEFLRGVAAEPAVVDLASLEWASLCALVAPNPKAVASVQTIEPSRFPQARLGFVPSLHWLELDPRAVSAFADGELACATPLPVKDPLRTRWPVAVWRSQHAVQHQVLEATEWAALLSAAGGATLSGVCTAFDSGSPAEDVQRAFHVLASWFARGWLERVVYDEVP
ncbi:MAG TPA: DNA-binding domain-containing protein [Polyangiaceae bacterium]|nr:DNA-binding domain-containing protein [Polyangiaceae bacterium]